MGSNLFDAVFPLSWRIDSNPHASATSKADSKCGLQIANSRPSPVSTINTEPPDRVIPGALLVR